MKRELMNRKIKKKYIHWSTVQFSCSVMSNSLQPHGLQHARLPCPLPSPEACSNSWPLSQWCHPPISSSVIPFCSCPQSFPALGSFLMSQLFTSGSQSIGASASAPVLPMSIQGWFLLELIGLISLTSILWHSALVTNTLTLPRNITQEPYSIVLS